MKKIFLLILILGIFVVAPSALAKEDYSFLASLSRIVQNLLESGEKIAVPSEEVDEEFVDPREVRQVLREIKDIRKELKRFVNQVKKLPNSADDLNKINTLLDQLTNFENSINTGTNLREVIQEFRDAQIWEEVNRLRAKIELPKEMTQWNKEIKRLEKMLKQKKYQNLGFNLEGTQTRLGEIKASLARVQDYYNSGDLENAMEEFNALREDLHPSEISNVLQRTQELMNRLKTIKDAGVKNQVQEAFGEVITNFNDGEYRIARELLDESFNEIAKMINQAFQVGKKKGYSKEGFFQMTDKLEETLKNKAEEKKARIQEIREKREEVEKPPQPTPVPEPTPTLPQTSPAPVPESPAISPSPETSPAPAEKTTTPTPIPSPTP